MTLETSQRIAIHRGNGIATVFPYTFPIFAATDLIVSLQDYTTGAITAVLTTAQFSVTGIGLASTGGSVTYTNGGTPLSSAFNIIIERKVAYTQTLELNNYGGFYPETLERALDYTVMQTQQLAEQQSRAVLSAVGGGSYQIALNLNDGDVLMKSGAQLIKGPNATDIGNAQGSAEAAAVSAASALNSANTAIDQLNKSIRFDVAQTLTTPQKEQAQANIGLVPGAGNGLDADLLDGQHGAYYANIPARLGYTPATAAQGAKADSAVFADIAFYGAVAGVNQKTAIEACIAAQVKNNTFVSFYSAMPNPNVCRVVITSAVSPIILTDYVDTSGAVIEYVVDDAVVFQADCGHFLNGNIYRNTRASMFHPHGQLDHSTTKSYSIGSGFLGFSALKKADTPALVNGWITQADSQINIDDGMVALQVNAGSPDNWFFRNEAVTYTGTTAVLITAVDTRRLRKNMMVQTLHATPRRGVLQSWSADGKTLTVNSWLAVGDTTKTPITPANGTGLLVNPKPKLWGVNITGTLTSDGYAYQMAVDETSLTNNKVQPASISDPTGRSWGKDSVVLNSLYKISAHYIARGQALFGFYSTGTDVGFEAGPVTDLGYARPTTAFAARAQTSAFNVYNTSDTLTAQILPDGSFNMQKLNLFGLVNAANDTAAASAGVPVSGVYRNGSVLQIRVS